MISAPSSRPTAKLKYALWLVSVFLATALRAAPADNSFWHLAQPLVDPQTQPLVEAKRLVAAQPTDPVWHLLIEPSYMHYETAWPIVGAERTVLVPARVVNGDLVPLKRSEIITLDATRPKILADAQLNAERALASLKPHYERDDNGVILYATLESTDGLAASAVLAPAFRTMFNDTLGPDPLIAIPTRDKVYIFPKDSSAYDDTEDIIIAEFQSSGHSVSREVFKFVNGHLVAIGYLR